MSEADPVVQKILSEAERLKRIPEKLNWNITGVLFGHGKVIVQAVDSKGKPVQFTGHVDHD